MISPTIGRIVWFTPGAYDEALRPFVVTHGQPMAAIVTHVWHDRMVNLTVFDPNGGTHPRTSIDLVQEGDDVGAAQSRCEWMPYQKGQAAKHEQLEKQLATKEPA